VNSLREAFLFSLLFFFSHLAKTFGLIAIFDGKIIPLHRNDSGVATGD
jgi:hypothetical protein